MTTTSVSLQSRVFSIQAALKEAKANGDWDRVDYLQLCLDDTRDELKAARREQATDKATGSAA